jgi:hypothetical protein
MGDILYAALEWYKVVKDRTEWLERAGEGLQMDWRGTGEAPGSGQEVVKRD